MTAQGGGATGPVIAIGGGEDDVGDCHVLRAVAEHAGGGALVVLTAASGEPGRRWRSYERAFGRLGVRRLRHVHVGDRGDASGAARLLDGATAVFITGGDQFRLMKRIGGTAVHRAIATLSRSGGTVAGTSAGAAALGEVMIGGSANRALAATAASGTGVRIAAGLGLLPGLIVDQHCTQRGRVARLAAAVGRHPGMLGIGVDEDTAVVCDHTGWAHVVGTGNVCVIDGRHGHTASTCHAAAHGVARVLSARDRYDVRSGLSRDRRGADQEQVAAGA